MKKLSNEYGVLIVQAIGNKTPFMATADDGWHVDNIDDIDNLILVGASDKNAYRASFSLLSSKESVNKRIVYAPGANVMTVSQNLMGFIQDYGASFGTYKKK